MLYTVAWDRGACQGGARAGVRHKKVPCAERRPTRRAEMPRRGTTVWHTPRAGRGASPDVRTGRVCQVRIRAASL